LVLFLGACLHYLYKPSETKAS